jgi:hypothetical protein
MINAVKGALWGVGILAAYCIYLASALALFGGVGILGAVALSMAAFLGALIRTSGNYDND